MSIRTRFEKVAAVEEMARGEGGVAGLVGWLVSSLTNMSSSE